jgi:E3 ubiquitin-protein ligase MARCH6
MHAYCGARPATHCVQVSILIGVELGVFPVLAGWWLDICTLEATGATFRHRRHFFAQAPVTSTFIHWLLGMLFMSHFASFAAILREVRQWPRDRL